VCYEQALYVGFNYQILTFNVLISIINFSFLVFDFVASVNETLVYVRGVK